MQNVELTDEEIRSLIKRKLNDLALAIERDYNYETVFKPEIQNALIRMQYLADTLSR